MQLYLLKIEISLFKVFVRKIWSHRKHECNWVLGYDYRKGYIHSLQLHKKTMMFIRIGCIGYGEEVVIIDWFMKQLTVEKIIIVIIHNNKRLDSSQFDLMHEAISDLMFGYWKPIVITSYNHTQITY